MLLPEIYPVSTSTELTHGAIPGRLAAYSAGPGSTSFQPAVHLGGPVLLARLTGRATAGHSRIHQDAWMPECDTRSHQNRAIPCDHRRSIELDRCVNHRGDVRPLHPYLP